jgi:hypothetical protein
VKTVVNIWPGEDERKKGKKIDLHNRRQQHGSKARVSNGSSCKEFSSSWNSTAKDRRPVLPISFKGNQKNRPVRYPNVGQVLCVLGGCCWTQQLDRLLYLGNNTTVSLLFFKRSAPNLKIFSFLLVITCFSASQDDDVICPRYISMHRSRPI